MSVPSLSTVMSMSMSTGMWKNSGHSFSSYYLCSYPFERSEEAMRDGDQESGKDASHDDVIQQ